MTALTPDDLARIEELAEKATPGPWAVNIAGELRAPSPYNGIMLARAWANGADGPDAEFIAAARTAIPALVAGVRSLQARITELEARSAEAEAVIAAAPHEYICHARVSLGAECNCWKSMAPSAAIASVRAQVWDESGDAHQAAGSPDYSPWPTNPYRSGAQHE